MIIERLQNGVVPWQKTWKTAYPKNFVSGLHYKGINLMLLGMQDFESNYWLSFKQCKDLGGSVKKDEHASMVVFWKPIVKITEKELDETTADVHFLLRYYYIFNVSQCEIPLAVLSKKDLIFTNPKIIEAEEIIKGYPNPPAIVTNGSIPNPRYLPRIDRIEIQPIGNFYSSDDYYASLFHELTHSTGAKHRLARKGIVDTIQFGSENYSKEELIAEIGDNKLKKPSPVSQPKKVFKITHNS
jgi:antirestriction protein ArdC